MLDAVPAVGVRALFTGPSGTGKTLAARLLAARLQKDLYRLDLSAVVNKYIGETEKNLNRVFEAAEELDVILLLDEGDALLGQRTDVQNANDRYANLETTFFSSDSRVTKASFSSPPMRGRAGSTARSSAGWT